MDDPATASPRPTLALVAARAGVSVSTASLVFSGRGPVSDETREKVRSAAAELDYAGPDPMARSLRRGSSGVVGIVIEDRLAEAFRDPMNLALLDGVADGLGDRGLGLLLLPVEADAASRLGEATVDAAVLLGCSTDVSTSVEALRRRRIPIVGVEAQRLDGVAIVDIENRAASRRGAEHLAALGHERVAVVTLPLDTARTRGPLTDGAVSASTGYSASERLFGAREVFPDLTGRVAAASTIDEGAVAGRALLDVPAAERPTAIIAQSDLLAVGVLRAAEELGVAVPGEVSVLGFDGIRLEGATSHVLTTLVQPAVEKGRAAAVAVLAALDGHDPEPVLLECELRVGTTTGPVRRG
jgi:DNA-binding LacI/PurR family transcriptional regulator